MSNLNKKSIVLLSAIVAATKSAEGQKHVDEKAAAPLVAAGLVELNVSERDGADNVAARATAAGLAYTPEAEAPAAKPSFTIATVALPEVKRASRAGTEKYPFDALEIGQSFFVPATEKTPDPKKSLASTVTSANARHATEIGGTRINRKGREVPATKQDRFFVSRSIEDGANWGHPGVKGAAIFRVPVTAENEGGDE